jgi:hypothetical protein
VARRLALAAGFLALAAAGCASNGPPPAPPAPAAHEATPDPAVFRRAEADRARMLELEIERLQADVKSAEETLVSVESGMRGAQTRAEAVSLLAQARIQVDRAAARAPWGADTVAEARTKLDDAERQLDQGHIGSAIFFVSRASRIAETLLAEADRVQHTPGTRFVRSARVNLRADPTTDAEVIDVLPAGLPVFPEQSLGEWALVRTVGGQVGWIHAALLRER